MAVKSEMAGTGFVPPPDAPRETVTGLGISAEMMASQVAMARANERELQPLNFPPPQPKVQPVQPAQSRLRTPGQTKPPVTTPAESVPAPAPRIHLTDAPAVEDRTTSAPIQPTSPHAPAVARPPVDPTTAAHLASPLAAAARKLQEQRQLTHQPAASNTDSPSRGVPQPAADPGKQITGGFGDAGDAQYFPMDGSELRELVRGLMSVISEQLTNDLRFSMALVYPRVSARVTVEIGAYAAGGDGGNYDPSFTIEKVKIYDKTPIEIARERADQVVFVVVAERVEMTPAGESISPPNAIREELGLTIPRKQAIQTGTGRVLVDIPA